MPGFSVMPNTLRVELLYSKDGQKLENVLHFDVGHNPVLEDVVTLAGVIIGWWEAHMKSLVSSDVSLTGLRFTNMEAQDGFQIEYTTGLPSAGTNEGGTTLPNNVTVAVRLGTAYRGRNATGRLFHVGMRSGDVVGNTLYSVFLPLLKAAYETLLSESLTAGFVWIVASQWLAGIRRPTALIQPIESISVDPTVDSQRRRLPGRGR